MKKTNFLTKDEDKKIEDKIQDAKEKINKINIAMDIISQHFDFDIPKYIVLEIVDEENYNHFCFLINLAIINNRITKTQANEIKVKIKEIFKITNKYDKLSMEKLVCSNY